MIRHTRDLRRLEDTLRAEPLLAVDTESNSMYAYQEQVCLVQLSTRTQDYIVDPLAVDDMSPLGELLADPAIEIVFHAAEYDIITLKRDFDYCFSRIFDTMLAARICGWDAVGLGSILEREFGIRAQKKYQRANWSTRPLPPEQLRYAQMDTHFLPELRDRLVTDLKAGGHLEEAYEIFSELPNLAPANNPFDPDGFWRIHAARDLSHRQMAILRELYLLRDDIAQRRDIPPFKVMNDKTLVEVASIAPRHVDDLLAINGVSRRIAYRHGDIILDAIARGSEAKPPRRPRPSQRPDPDIQERYDALHTWRKERAAQRGVESDVIVPRDALWALARRNPARVEDLGEIPGLGPWRQAEYGSELIAVLRGQQVDGD
jgi:ribonuclease D